MKTVEESEKTMYVGSYPLIIVSSSRWDPKFPHNEAECLLGGSRPLPKYEHEEAQVAEFSTEKQAFHCL
ncbi:hypothetical protein PHLCEN_2v11477 [Hermanssonia centrifuga]|uniref:Uncharacterized protein n=1 Tax=Hermanssonia centrifuga TaxID=98765 RepID=A0A2R6NJX1_9APHY|nr:hypothetical protein PHLCEN_2v11477 [Hermanssonia centrifuga]